MAILYAKVYRMMSDLERQYGCEMSKDDVWEMFFTAHKAVELAEEEPIKT
jgi:hypothetical protein